MIVKYGKYIKGLRLFRVVHRYLGVSVALLLLISAVTGILLALKKDVALIQPPTHKGLQQNLKDWKSLDDLALMAQEALYKAHPVEQGNLIDRIDVRPSKGMVKVLFDQAQWEVQLDGSTGAVLSIARRHSDWIEALHDGSIISDAFKLVSMNFLGIGVVFLISTGLWLWYGPKKLRRLKKRIRRRSETVNGER